MKKLRNFRRHLILPVTYLILDLVEDVLIYKSELIANVYLRTAVVIGILAFGISILAFALVPFLEGGLDALHKSSKKHGAIGELIFTILLLGAIYYLYYIKTRAGNEIEPLLPEFMKNQLLATL